jgi:hypothetical protein
MPTLNGKQHELKRSESEIGMERNKTARTRNEKLFMIITLNGITFS